MKSRTKLSLAILPLLFVLSCSLPLDPAAGPVAAAEGGYLAISVSRQADWLASYTKSLSRALLYATSVKIEVKDSSGIEIIAPVFQAVGAVTTNATTGLQTLGAIPTGSGYSVTVSVYNSVNSATAPVAVGTATGVTIVKDQTTDLTVLCLPATTTAITATGGPYSAALAKDGEAWYSVPFAAGSNYTVSQATFGIGTFLFSPAGEYIATITDTSPYTYLCKQDGVYLIGLAGTTAATSSVAISVYVPPKSEGSIASPVAVPPDATRTFIVGKAGSGEDNSYYSFTTGPAGTWYFDYRLTLPPDLVMRLYADSTFATELASFSYLAAGLRLGALAASTTYYLKVTNQGTTANFEYPGVIASPAYQAANAANEGSKASPVPLGLGADYPARLGHHSFDSISYYSFTTESAAAYKLTMYGDDRSLKATFYSNAAFTTAVAPGLWLDKAQGYGQILQPGTTYWLAVQNDPVVAADLNFSLRLDAVPTLALSTLNLGNLTASEQTLWYEVPVSPGASYSFSLSDGYSNSVVYGADVKARLYAADMSTMLLTDYIDDTDLHPKPTIVIPAGQTRFYIKVEAFGAWADGSFGIQVDPL